MALEHTLGRRARQFMWLTPLSGNIVSRQHRIFMTRQESLIRWSIFIFFSDRWFCAISKILQRWTSIRATPLLRVPANMLERVLSIRHMFTRRLICLKWWREVRKPGVRDLLSVAHVVLLCRRCVLPRMPVEC